MRKANFTFLKALSIVLLTIGLSLQLDAQCGDNGLTFDEAVSIAKNCDGSISIMWLELTSGADDAGHTYGVTIYKVTQDQGNVEVLDFDDLTERSILLEEGALEINQEYIMSLNEFCTDGATTQLTGQIFDEFPDNVENAEPTFEVVSTTGPQCSNDDVGDDSFNGSITFQIKKPTYANCTGATFDVYIDDTDFGTAGLGDATNLGRFGFDENITAEDLGTGTFYIALDDPQDDKDCSFQIEACLNEADELTTLEVEDTNEPELGVSIEDDVFGTFIENDGGETDYNLGTLDPGEDCCFTLDFGYIVEDNCDGAPEITIDTEGDVTFEVNEGPVSQD